MSITTIDLYRIHPYLQAICVVSASRGSGHSIYGETNSAYSESSPCQRSPAQWDPFERQTTDFASLYHAKSVKVVKVACMRLVSTSRPASQI